MIQISMEEVVVPEVRADSHSLLHLRNRKPFRSERALPLQKVIIYSSNPKMIYLNPESILIVYPLILKSD